ncbi:hypothetical protein [Campylobacter sputorum]|uniref:hypothetical protein n=1 Tax=Campylobacter sputorum TaxID=206 RepID=UPI00053BF636|nr:hypothetical protein [Campylobacter sputorum]
MDSFELKVLSTRKEEATSGTCYLCESSLEKYINAIPERYKDYDIQRGIVNNVYLDRLTQTILERRYIPPIVLIAEERPLYDENTNKIIINGFKILDGLQRTYRIKAIFHTLDLYIQELKKGSDFSEMGKFRLSRKYKDELLKANSNATILWSIHEIAHKKFYDLKEKKYDLEALKSIFSNSKQWFEVWDGLDKSEQINKMLILNAGHKSMDIKHQLELLFLNVIPDNFLKDFVRAKDVNSSFFYNKKELGQLHLSHFISALLAFHKAEPITVDAKYLQNLQDNLDIELEKIKYYFEQENLKELIEFTKDLDCIFNEEYENIGIEWLGRETILMGLFAAFGKYYQFNKKDKEDSDLLLKCLQEIKKILKNNIYIFKIKEFNDAKTRSIDITKVNIGNVFKYATFNAVSQLLLNDEKNIDWDKLFKNGTRKYDEQ